MSGNKDSRYGSQTERLKAMRDANNPDGVALNPIPVTQGDEVTVLYYGTLADGADQLYLHYGYGDAQRWQQTQDLRMEQTDRGWATTFQVKDTSQMNFCFKDSANNWDNNGGLDWTVGIHRGD